MSVFVSDPDRNVIELRGPDQADIEGRPAMRSLNGNRPSLAVGAKGRFLDALVTLGRSRKNAFCGHAQITTALG